MHHIIVRRTAYALAGLLVVAILIFAVIVTA